MKLFNQFKKNSPYWDVYTYHDFVRQIGSGCLDKSCFQYYLKQDYLFLIQFTRAWALAIFKSKDLNQMRYASRHVDALVNQEINLHISYCQSWGIVDDLADTIESSACVAYTRYVLDCGMTYGIAELYAALLPCIVGYAEIGQRLFLSKEYPLDKNPYASWIKSYADEAYQNIAFSCADHFDEICKEMSNQELIELKKIFDTATRMEVDFWQMGLDKS